MGVDFGLNGLSTLLLFPAALAALTCTRNSRKLRNSSEQPMENHLQHHHQHSSSCRRESADSLAANGGSSSDFSSNLKTSVAKPENLAFSGQGFDVPKSKGHFFTSVICMACGTTITVPVYCGNRFCQICSRARRGRVYRRLKFMLDNMQKIRGYSLKMLTFTISNQADLPAMLQVLVKSFRILRSRAWWKNSVEGGAFVLEVTGRPGNWHAHIHTLCSCRYLPWDSLRALWFRISGGRGVYISQCHGTTHAAYLTKYITKTDAPDQVSAEIAANLKGFRLFQPFGSWFKIIKNFPKHHPACKRCKTEGCFSLAGPEIGGAFQFYLNGGEVQMWMDRVIEPISRDPDAICYEDKAPF